MLPSPGYTGVELRMAEPQGINPKDLLLRVHADEPTGYEPQVMTPYGVEYQDEPSTEYETVSIVPDGPAGIAVQHVE